MSRTKRPMIRKWELITWILQKKGLDSLVDLAYRIDQVLLQLYPDHYTYRWVEFVENRPDYRLIKMFSEYYKFRGLMTAGEHCVACQEHHMGCQECDFGVVQGGYCCEDMCCWFDRIYNGISLGGWYRD